MGLRVQTNMQAVSSQKNLAIAVNANDEAMQKVSSGYRINKAADDSAGLAISEKLKADIRGLNMAKRNANDGISLIQVAEGSMSEITNILSRLRELSVQSASDTIGNDERKIAHQEFKQLRDEIDRVTYSTEYNGTLLLSNGKLKDDEGNEIKHEELDTGALPASMQTRTNKPPLEIQIGKNWSVETDGALNDGETSDRARMDAGGYYNDKDGSAKVTNDRFAANPINQIRLNFDQINTSAAGLGLVDIKEIRGGQDIKQTKAEGLLTSAGLYYTDTGAAGMDQDLSKRRAQMSIQKIDDAIKKLSTFRADLGAGQNRLTSVVNNLAVQTENYQAANSRIRDTDFAEASTEMTKSNIIKQGGVAVLTQANQSPSLAMQLLR